MSEPFLAEIKIASFDFAPKGWAQCNGQLLPINENQALFSLLGTVYGGDGRVNFGLPDLRGRVPVHMGSGIVLGERGGEENHTLSISELPSHTHPVKASPSAPDQGSPSGNLWASAASSYAGSANTTMNPANVLSQGGSQAHLNMSPFLVLSFIIALQGIFPSQN